MLLNGNLTIAILFLNGDYEMGRHFSQTDCKYNPTSTYNYLDYSNYVKYKNNVGEMKILTHTYIF